MSKKELIGEKIFILMKWGFFAYLVVTSPFFFFPKLGSVWIVWLAFVFIFYFFLLAADFRNRSALDLVLLLFMVQLFINLLIIPDPAFSLAKIMGAFYGVLVFYGLMEILRTRKLAFVFLTLFLLTGTGLSLGGVMGMMWNPESFFSRLVDLFSKIVPRFSYKLPGAEAGINPNPLGGSLLLFLPLTFYLLLSYLDKNGPNFPLKIDTYLFIFSLFSLYVMLTALFLTQSVGSWLALILTAFIFLFLRGNWKRRTVAMAILILLTVAVIYSWGNLKKISPLEQFFYSKMSSRLSFWKLGLEIIKEHPLAGIGMNRVRLKPEVGYEAAHLHNHMLHTAAEMGLPALLAYLAMLCLAGYMCYQTYRNSKEGWMRAASLGLGAGQMAHFFYGLTDSIPFGAKPGIFFWISLALINGLYNLEFRGEIKRNELINKSSHKKDA